MTGAAEHDRVLFHFTASAELPRLLRELELPSDDSVTRGLAGLLTGRGRGGLVWLTDSADLLLAQSRGMADVRPGLRRPAGELVRVTVAVADAQYWPHWARRHAVGRRLRRRIDAGAGGSSGRWWVVARTVPSAEWLRLDAVGGTRLWPDSHGPARPQLLVPSVYRRAEVDWPTRARAGGVHRPPPRPR
jgi:hypothetical protein